MLLNVRKGQQPDEFTFPFNIRNNYDMHDTRPLPSIPIILEKNRNIVHHPKPKTIVATAKKGQLKLRYLLHNLLSALPFQVPSLFRKSMR